MPNMSLLAAPSAPLNLIFSPGDVLNDSITLTWLPPQHPNGVVHFYQLQLSSSGGDLFVNTTDNTTTTVLSNLAPGTQYNFLVRAFTVTFGPFSDQLSALTADGEALYTTICDMIGCSPMRWRVEQKSIPLLWYSFHFLPPSVPSVPQRVSAISNSSTSVFVTWMVPAVFFREYIHNCCTMIAFITKIVLQCKLQNTS